MKNNKKIKICNENTDWQHLIFGHLHVMTVVAPDISIKTSIMQIQ